MLADYVTGGGKLLVMAGPVDGASLDNLYSLLSKYGVTANEGIVIESDREHYAFQAPFALLPDLASSAITDSLIDERYFPILPLSLGRTVGEDTNGATVTPLLTTSDASYSKLAGYELDTYDKEEGDLDGPFTLAVSVEAGSGQMRDDLGIAFGIDVLRHHRKTIFRRNVAHVVIPLTNDIGNPAVQPFQGS